MKIFIKKTKPLEFPTETRMFNEIMRVVISEDYDIVHDLDIVKGEYQNG